MYFMIYCEDKPDSLALRQQTRAAHLEHIKQHDAQVIVGGATLTDDADATMNGSLIIVDMLDKAAAEAFAAADPYRKAGLFQKVTIRPMKIVKMTAIE